MTNKDIEQLVRPNIRALLPYSTARDEYQGEIGIFLDANESPYDTGYNRYPDPHQKALKARLSEIKGVPVSQIFIGNGSDEAIDLVFRVFCRPGVDSIVAIDPSYGMYKVCADINDIALKEVALNEDFSLPVERLLEACDANTKLIFICSPNNPSGNSFPAEKIEELLKNFNGIVVLDEAYNDFSCQKSFRFRLDEFPNLIILQTLSKAYGMASLRLGIAYASEYIIRLMSMVKYPYNINGATQRIVMDILKQDISERVAIIVKERDSLIKLLENYTFIKKVYPSDSNFILVKTDDADALYSYLLEAGIIVRNRTKATLCGNCVRITVGLPEENKKLIESLSQYESKYEKGVICR
ncbi:MAG: histidinol-phosphate transaminase [Bacteroidales bacterium]|nr:histidinol-phosphate transaminase [Bacteroidales bacterium]